MTDKMEKDTGVEEQHFPVSMGVPEMLKMASEKLLAASNELDSHCKEELYRSIDTILEKCSGRIKDIISLLEYSEEATQKVKDLCREVDEKFLQASNLHLGAIECLRRFMETEESPFLEKANIAMKDGEVLLEQADSKARELSDFSLLDKVYK